MQNLFGDWAVRPDRILKPLSGPVLLRESETVFLERLGQMSSQSGNGWIDSFRVGELTYSRTSINEASVKQLKATTCLRFHGSMPLDV